MPRIMRRALGRARSWVPPLHPLALGELWAEWTGGHDAAPDHGPHLEAAIDWIVRAQEATGTGGIARGYSLAWNGYFGQHGWQHAYPETTGYLIPTLYAAARRLHRPELAARANQAAVWERAVQLPSGAVQGGVIGQPVTPAIFNTGQVIFGWLSAWEYTGDAAYEESVHRAAAYLVSMLDTDGIWRRANSVFALANATLYNTRTAWALAEAGRRLGEPRYLSAAAHNLHAVAERQHDNAWFPECCLSDPARPLLHTIAYTIRGLLEGGRVLGDSVLIARAASAAAMVARAVTPEGTLPGRLDAMWNRAASWRCLTGEAQMAGIWIRLFEITGERAWLHPVPHVIGALKRSQNRTSANPGLRGGIKGASPLHGAYGSWETLNWATKFFADLLMRHERVLAGVTPADDDVLLLA